MKNSLDEVNCIPAPRGRKGPYQVISHEYCIDLFASYQRLADMGAKAETTADAVKESAKLYCQYHQVDFNFHFGSRIPLIVPPVVNNFQWHLAVYLMTFDVNRIHALLSFQQKRHVNKELDFVTFVEFPVYRIVKYWSSFFDNSQRLVRIMQWVDREREKHDIVAALPPVVDPKPIEIKKIEKGENQRTVPPSFKLRILKVDKRHLDKQEVHRAFESLLGGGFIDSTTEFSQFIAVLSGSSIDPNQRISWIPNLKSLNVFIMMLAPALENKKDKWEIACKCFTKEGMNIAPKQVQKPNGKDPDRSKLKEIINLITS